VDRETDDAGKRRDLERLAATLGAQGLGPEAAATRALDATIRPPGLAEKRARPEAAGPAPSRTAPFLPSITLSEGRADEGPGADGGADLLVGDRLGEGGMGVVHVAAQRSLERSVAIKRPVAEDGAAGLVDEGRVMALVEHPNVVPVHALGRDGSGRPVLVMKPSPSRAHTRSRTSPETLLRSRSRTRSSCTWRSSPWAPSSSPGCSPSARSPPPW
jgi:hypothetical protein